MTIRTLQWHPQEQSQTLRLVMEIFAGKFAKVKLPQEELFQLTQLIWAFPNQTSSNKQYVSEVNGEVVATMALMRENTGIDHELSLMKLGKKFGYRNVLKLLLRLLVLDHKLLPGEVYVDHLVSHPSMRGKGIGTQLLQMAQESLAQEEYLTLYVAGSNYQAQKLYAKLGFRVVKKERSYLSKLLTGEKIWYYMAWQR